MRKFTNGNRNVDKLIQEAKNLKSTRNAESMNAKRQEYAGYLNSLPGLTNQNKKTLLNSGNLSRNAAKQLSNKRLEQVRINTKKGFINFMTELGITNQYRDELLGNFNANRMTMNALKNKATKIAQKIKNDRNAKLKTTLNARLGELGLNQVNKNTIMRKFANGNRNVDKLIQEAKNLKSVRNAESLDAKRQEYAGYLNTLPGLTNENKKTLLNSGNLSRNAAKQMSNKRLEQAKINSKKGFVNFMTELGITNQYRDELLDNFNSNRMTMNALKNKAAKVAQKIKNDKNVELKTKLNTRLGELGLNQINKNTIMRKFANGNRNVDKLIQEAKNLKSTRNAESLNAKRREYAGYLNTLPGLTNEDKKTLLNSENLNRNQAKQMSNKRLEQAKINSKKGFINFMTELGITNQYRDELLDNFNANRMTMNALKNKANQSCSED
jgi:ABC-type transporter Mla MlaB component/ribosomal protein S17E